MYVYIHTYITAAQKMKMALKKTLITMGVFVKPALPLNLGGG
jgi:hypothetical protein